MMRFAVAMVASFAGTMMAGGAGAQKVPTEVGSLGQQQVTVHQHEWLSEEEVSTLRLVASNEDALSLFVTRPGRYAALAVAPDEGFIRDGQPVRSATAISDLPNAPAARVAALEGCEKAKRKGPACVVILEVAPLR